MNKFLNYNLISFFSYILLVVKFPLLLMLDKTDENLSTYFIIISFSLATNFISSDLFSYKKLNTGINVTELFIAALIFVCSIILIYIYYVHLFLYFIIFNVSLLLNSITISRLRELNIKYIIYQEILLSVSQICISILITATFHITLGHSLIITTSLSYLFFFFFLLLFNLIDFKSITLKYERKILSLNLYFDMLVTQVERLILSVFLPSILVYISIISSLISGLKRLIHDDNQMHNSIMDPHFDFNRLAVKYSTNFIYINILFLLLYLSHFFESTYFIIAIKNIKPNFNIETLNYLFVIAFFYFGINPISYFVVHQFRNDTFKLKYAIIYLPIIIYTTFFVQKHSNLSDFILILLSFTTLHFILFFALYSFKYYRLTSKSILMLSTNYFIGFFASIYVSIA